jgi:hypothetical protein
VTCLTPAARRPAGTWPFAAAYGLLMLAPTRVVRLCREAGLSAPPRPRDAIRTWTAVTGSGSGRSS